MTLHLRKPIGLAILFFAQIVLTYLVVETGYRWYYHRDLDAEISGIILSQSPLPEKGHAARIFDQYSGYRYPPHAENHLGYPWFTHWHTNSHGHRSNEEYPVEKPPGEFRIAVVGDSFTANITSNVSWTDELQSRLNGSDKWRAAVQNQNTRVINFGIDGTGFEHYPGVVLHHVPPFKPDLIIVNFVVDDILRKMQRESIGRRPERSVRDVVNVIMAPIDWFEPCSLILTRTIGPYWNIGCKRIPSDPQEFAYQRTYQLRRHPTREQAITASVEAIRDIMSTKTPLIFLHHPMAEELNFTAQNWAGLVEDVQQRLPTWRFTSTLPQLSARLDGRRVSDRQEWSALTPSQLGALPQAEKPELYRLFYLPADAHYTDHGNRVYGEIVADFLIGTTLGQDPLGSR
jgi:hypothetical protein